MSSTSEPPEESLSTASTSSTSFRPSASGIWRFAWIVGLLLPPLVLFWQELLGHSSLFSGDTFHYFYPYRYTLWQGLQHHFLPLWEDGALSGNPFCASPQANCYYPPSLLYLWPDFLQAYQWSVIFHLVVGGLGIGFWLKGRGYAASTAWFGGALWQLSGATLSMVNRLDKLESLTWWGFALFFFERLLGGIQADSDGAPKTEPPLPPVWKRSVPAWRAALPPLMGLVAALSLQLLSGGLEILVMSVLGFCIHGVLAFQPWRRLERKPFFTLTLWLAGAGLVCAGLTMVQWLPMFELMGQSVRSNGMSVQRILELSMAPGDLWGLLSPRLFLEPETLHFLQATGRSSAPRYYYGLYMGLLPLALVAVGVASGLGKTRRRAEVLAATGMVMLGLLLALGSHNPLYEHVLVNLPVFSSMRFPEKFLALVGVGMLPLAAEGLEHFSRSSRWQRWLMLGFGVVVLGVQLLPRVILGPWAFLLSVTTPALSSSVEGQVWPGMGTFSSVEWLGWLFFLRPQLLVSLVVAFAATALLALASRMAQRDDSRAIVLQLIALLLVMGEVGGFNQALNVAVDRAALASAPALARAVQAEGPGTRIHVAPLYLKQPLDAPANPTADVVEAYQYLRELLYPNLGMIFNVAYGDGTRAIRLRSQTQAFAPLSKVSLALQVQALRQFGVPLIVTRDDPTGIAPENDPTKLEGLERVAQAGTLSLWRISDVAPLAWFLPDSAPGNQKGRREALNEGASAAESTILLYSPEVGQRLTQERAQGGRLVTIAAPHNSDGGWVVMPETWYPGWKAWVDGAPVPCQAVNVYQRGVRVPKGWRLLTLRFEPNFALLSAAVSLLSLVAWLALLFLGLRGSRGREAEEYTAARAKADTQF